MNPMIVPTNVNTPPNIDSAVNILANISAIRPPETVASAYAYDLTELQQNVRMLNKFFKV